MNICVFFSYSHFYLNYWNKDIVKREFINYSSYRNFEYMSYTLMNTQELLLFKYISYGYQISEFIKISNSLEFLLRDINNAIYIFESFEPDAVVLTVLKSTVTIPIQSGKFPLYVLFLM